VFFIAYGLTDLQVCFVIFCFSMKRDQEANKERARGHP